MSIRKDVNRLTLREIARFKAGSDVLEITGRKFKFSLILLVTDC